MPENAVANRFYTETPISRESGTARLSDKQINQVRTAFHHDAKILPFCRRFTPNEIKTLRNGTRQRAKAIHLFLTDHYFGKKSYLAAKIFPRNVLEKIFNRSFATDSSRPARPENLQFWYGPDVIRDPDGSFRVVEDNVGFIGGLGDLNVAAQTAEIITGERGYQAAAAKYYSDIAEFYRREAQRFGSGAVVFLSYPKNIRVTHEDERLEKALSPFGIKAVKLADLQCRDGQVYRGKTKVSFVILNIDTADIEPESPATYRRYLAHGIEEAPSRARPKLEKLLSLGGEYTELRRALGNLREVNVARAGKPPGVPGFWDAVSAGRVGVSVPPGIEPVNDKEFYLYVDPLIEFYLREKPKLQSLATHSLSTQSARQRVFSRLEDWVIKSAVSKCGEGVWIGHRSTPQQKRALIKKVNARPSDFVAQRFVEFSRLNDYSVDARPFALVSSSSIIVSPLPWGRAIPAEGSGKVNISDGGRLVIAALG